MSIGLVNSCGWIPCQLSFPSSNLFGYPRGLLQSSDSTHRSRHVSYFTQIKIKKKQRKKYVGTAVQDFDLMTKSQRLCDKQDTLTDETIQRQSSACQSLRRSTHTSHVPQPRISFANDVALVCTQPTINKLRPFHDYRLDYLLPD